MGGMDDVLRLWETSLRNLLCGGRNQETWVRFDESWVPFRDGPARTAQQQTPQVRGRRKERTTASCFGHSAISKV